MHVTPVEQSGLSVKIFLLLVVLRLSLPTGFQLGSAEQSFLWVRFISLRSIWHLPALSKRNSTSPSSWIVWDLWREHTVQLLRGFCHHKPIYSWNNTWLYSTLLYLLCPATCQPYIHGSNRKIMDATEYFSVSSAPVPVIPGAPFTSHNNGRILYLGSDEVHSNHRCQVIHTHLVDTGVQLYFV